MSIYHNNKLAALFIVLFTVAVYISGCDSSEDMFGLTGLSVFHTMDDPENTYYVSSLGAGSGDGSDESNAMSFSAAITNAKANNGNTYLLLDDNYGSVILENFGAHTNWNVLRGLYDDASINSLSINNADNAIYIRFENINFTGTANVRATSHVYFFNNTFDMDDYSENTAIAITSTATGNAPFVTIESNTIRDCWRGISVRGNSNWVIKDNHITHFLEDGINFHTGNCSNILVENNHIHDHNLDLAQNSRDLIMYQHSSVSSNVTIRNNTLHGSTDQGVSFYVDAGSNSDFIFENNLIYNISSAALIVEGTTEFKINNNTIDRIVRLGQSHSGTLDVNSIFSNMSGNIITLFTKDIDDYGGGSSGDYTRVINHSLNIFGNDPVFTTGHSYPFNPGETENVGIDIESELDSDYRPLSTSLACSEGLITHGHLTGQSCGTVVPLISLVYPSNTTYSSNITSINYTHTNGQYCWYSTDSGATNSSAVSAGTNWTGLNLGSSTLTVYCNNSNGTIANDTVAFTVDSCVPSLVNTSWSEWTNISCLASDLMSQSRNMTEYDSNNCGEVGNTTYTEYRQTEACDYCVPSLTNTTWSLWANISCLASDLMNQSRNRTEYDSNNCGEVDNTTYVEYRQSESCDYCLPSLTNTSWSSWLNVSCLPSDLMNQSRNMTEYDSNNCGEVGNITYIQYRQTESCDQCTPLLTNSSWSEWTNISCLPSDLMNQSRYRIQYDSNNCSETSNLTFYDYRATEYCHFMDNDGDNISDSMDCNDFNISINICRGCLICNDTVSSNESRGECKPSTNVAAINRTELGCPLPIYDKFSRNMSTNLSRINLTSAANVSIGITGKGKIKFVPAIDLYRNTSNVFYPLDMDSFINITDKRISLDSSNLPELNVSTELTFYNVTYSNPIVKKNGEDFNDYFVLQLPNSSNDYAMVINVSSFTYYEVVDNSTEEDDSGDDTTTTSSSGGGGEGGSLGKKIILSPEWSSVQLRVNEKVLFDHDNESHHIFVDKINTGSVDISVYSERIALNLKEGRWARVDLDKDNKNDIDVMYYGLNGSKAKIGMRLNGDTVAVGKISEERIEEEAVPEDTGEHVNINEEQQPEIPEMPAPAEKSFLLRYWIVLLSALLSLPILFMVVYAATRHMQYSLLKWKYFSYFSKEERAKRSYRLSKQELTALKRFVRKCQKLALSKEKITKMCVDVGWKKEVIEKVLEECE